MLLLSDGIDSPVAGYQMANQGVELIVLHFTTSVDDPDGQLANAKDIVTRLEASVGTSIRVFVVPHTETLKTLSAKCRKNLTCVLCKRMMLRVAGALAEDTGSAFIITGDSLGQVASQTLANLFVEEQATQVPVLRPLIGMDKVEITRIAKAIDTYEISASSGTHCVFAPERPSTNSTQEEVSEEEERTDVHSIAAEAKSRMTEVERGEGA